MTLAAGARLGPYEVESLIGSGGMGEVYRARDPRLNRLVALKIIAHEHASHLVRRDRFRREAQAIATLNHPNIVTVFSSEETTDGGLLLTMELVEGKVLSDLIPRGGLPVDRLLRIAVQIADAIGAAHDRGVVHRDLKPRNVMVTPDGRVKVLDFGLAKLRDVASDGAGTLSTAPMHELTAEGRILGTAAYMSPEQAEGNPVDHRTDIFSMGIVLYEMTTGERPFKGESAISVLSAILRDTPRAVTDINPRAPRELARIIRRCLAKEPDERYQSSKDIRNDLNDLRQELTSGEQAAPDLPKSRWRWQTIALPLALAAAGVAIWFAARGTAPRSAPALPVNAMQLTFDPGVESSPSLSPDGRWIVYARSNADGRNDIYLQAVGGERPINLTEGSGASNGQPVFSPDGERIAFASGRQGGGLFVMGRTGELVRRVSDRGHSSAWSPDGKALVYTTSYAGDQPYAHPGSSELSIVDLESGKHRLLLQGDVVRPAWSPNGHRIAYWGTDPATHYRDLWTIPASGGSPVRLTNDAAVDSSPSWSPDGRFVYFASDRGGTLNLWRIRIDEATGRREGDPEPVTVPAPTAVRPTLSADGRRIAYNTHVSGGHVQVLTLDPTTVTVSGPPSRVAGGPHNWSAAKVSPDDVWLALVRWTHQQDLFVVRTDGTGLRRVTGEAAGVRCPAWAPDSRQVAYVGFLRTARSVLFVETDSGAVRELTPVGTAGWLGCPVWSPDGTRMAISQSPEDPAAFIFDPRRPWSDDHVQRLPDPPQGAFVPRSWSPDGRMLAGTASRQLVTYDVQARTFEVAAPDVRAQAASASEWLPDSRHLVLSLQPGAVHVVDVVNKRVRELLSVAPDIVRGFSVSRDGRRLYVSRGPEEGDIWVAELGTRN